MPRTREPATPGTSVGRWLAVRCYGQPARLWAGKPVKYQAVADALREQIASGALPPASPLPSETQLIETYGISRPTARAAIAALQTEGLIIVLHGKGAFVRRASDRPTHTDTRTVQRDNGAYLDADTDTPGWRPVEQPATYRTNATADLALAIDIAEHSPLFVYDRLLADAADRRVLHRLYLPFTVCADIPDLTDNPFRATGQLFTILANAGHTLSWDDYISARMPAPTTPTHCTSPTARPCSPTAASRSRHGHALALEETRPQRRRHQLHYPLDLHRDNGTADPG